MFTDQLERIEKIEKELKPISDRLNSHNEKIKSSLSVINKTLEDYIYSKVDLDSDTKVNFDICDNYTRINVTNTKSKGYNSDLTIELHGFNSFGLVSKEKKLFDPTKSKFTVSGSSSNVGLDDIQSMDRGIIQGVLLMELKKFGSGKESLFTILNNYLVGYYNELQLKMYELRSETYPLTNQLNKIEQEMKRIEQEMEDQRVLDEIRSNIGNRFEFDSEKKQYRLNNLMSLFNINYFPSIVTIVKVNTKTVEIDLSGNLKRVQKEDMIKKFQYLKRHYTENERKLEDRKQIINKLIEL